ncbi:MAG: type II secretion system major pseudopilin GspG [Desulfobacterales bacterium]
MNRRFPVKKTDCRGFTLIELMVVIVILGILAGLIIPRIMGRPEEAKRLKAQIQIESLETALKLYRLDNGMYPDTEQGLQALIEEPETGTLPKNWRKGGYLEKGRLPKDPWGNDFVYLSPGVHDEYDIMSYGSDGVPGGEDKNKDINSWEIE